MTAQLTELLTQFGPIAEVWIDCPGELGRGFRTFLYGEIARLQPQIVIMMNSGGPNCSENYDVAYAWPSDLIAVECGLPPRSGHRKWRSIEGKRYYVPCEVCDPIGKHWFWVKGDKPRSNESLVEQFNACRAREANLLLNVPPDQRGVIPDESVAALMRLQRNVEI